MRVQIPLVTPSNTMKSLIASILLTTVSLTAQLPPLPAQSYFDVGKTDWAVVCGDYSPNCYMTSQPWNRTIDPSYPGTTTRYSVNVGGIFYCRAEQHDICPGYMGPGTGFATYFYFGPRTGILTSLASITGFQLGQSTVFNSSPVASLYNSQYQGPNEFNGAIQTWAYQVDVPNNPALSGQEWACQALALTAATMTFNLGGSHYTKIL